MLSILAVCTGNICRSPIVQYVLESRLADSGVRVLSAGTRTRTGMRMPEQAVRLATTAGASMGRVAQHAAQSLTDVHLRSSDLVLALARTHRREIVETTPAVMRRTFALGELPRLLEGVDDWTLQSAAGHGGPQDRMAAMLATIAAQRGLVLAPQDPEADDVVDPYGRSEQTYQRSLQQILEALPSAERLIRLALA